MAGQKFNPHNPRHSVADDQIVIGPQREGGLLEVDHQKFQEGRSDDPELVSHLMNPSTPEHDYAEHAGFDQVVTLRKQANDVAEAAKAMFLINKALEAIDDELPEISIVASIDTLLKSHHEEKEEEDDKEGVEKMKKTNLPYSPTPKDSVAEVSPSEQSSSTE